MRTPRARTRSCSLAGCGARCARVPLQRLDGFVSPLGTNPLSGLLWRGNRTLTGVVNPWCARVWLVANTQDHVRHGACALRAPLNQRTTTKSITRCARRAPPRHGAKRTKASAGTVLRLVRAARATSASLRGKASSPAERRPCAGVRRVGHGQRRRERASTAARRGDRRRAGARVRRGPGGSGVGEAAVCSRVAGARSARTRLHAPGAGA